jgi:hypothetical protein
VESASTKVNMELHMICRIKLNDILKFVALILLHFILCYGLG